MATRTITFAAASSILGGWLPIMAPAVVTIALRLGEFDATGLDSTYALILGAGWLAMIVSLVVTGSASDALQRRGANRTVLVRVSAPLIAVGGVLMALAPSTSWLAVVWILIQVPSAAVITTAMADGGAHLRGDLRSLVSGWAGAMPILALLVGTIGVRALSDSLAWAFIVPAAVGALLCLPLAATTSSAAPPRAPDPNRVTQRLSLGRLWAVFLVASFLLAWTTSTVNGFLVVFVQERIAANLDDIADASTLAVILAASIAVVASIAAGRFAHGIVLPLRIWWVAAGSCAAALVVLVVVPSSLSLLVVAACFGVAFGVANGVELGVVVALRDRDALLGRDMGTLTAVTTAPYVLVPAIASLLLIDSAQEGVTALFALASTTAALGALLLAIGSGRQVKVRDR